MLTSTSDDVDAGRIVDGVGVERRPTAPNSMRPRCVTPRLAPSPMTLARDRPPVTRIASLARSPTSASVSLGAHIGADAAEPEQVDSALRMAS
jgi:hypothetical protein